MAYYSILLKGKFHNGVCKIVHLHNKRLCADVSSLNDLLLRSFVVYVTNEPNLSITIEQFMRNVTNGNTSEEMKKKGST